MESKPSADAVTKPSEAEAARGFTRPLRDAVVHVVAGKRCPVTILPADVADLFARQPTVLDRVRCSACRQDFPASAFTWHGSDDRVGS
jgi:hypothetical protein